jgi:mono/diheme cytochrome c family protein
MHRKLFYLFNFLVLGLFVAAGVVDNKREWKDYQKQYKRMEIARIETALTSAPEEEKASLELALKTAKSMPIRLRQAMSYDLNRYDRCVSCHLGVDPETNPLQVNEYDEHPFKAPEIPEHLSHPANEFACTSCHQGQGLATTVEDAHGFVKHWEEPLLKKPYIQGTCVRCHDNFEEIKGTSEVRRGRELFVKLGCIGCHSMKGSGGEVSVDLGDIADKPVSRIDWAYTGPLPPNQRNILNWIEMHLTKDTIELVPGDPHGHSCAHLDNCEPVAPSGMPPFYTILSYEEAQALTAYLLGMTDKTLPKQYKVPAPEKPAPRYANSIEHGKFVFEKYGCAGCHGEGGAAGWRNFNALGEGQDKAHVHDIAEMAKGREPTLTKVVGTYSRDELRKKLHDGVPPSAVVKFNPEGPTPPLYMPAWKSKIKGKEMEALLDYLFSTAEDTGEEW